MTAGVCTSRDFRAFASDGGLSDALLYAVVLQMGLHQHSAYLLPSMVFVHMRQRNAEPFKSISRENIWVFTVPEEEGRMAVLINWKRRSIQHYIPPAEERNSQNQSSLKVGPTVAALDSNSL